MPLIRKLTLLALLATLVRAQPSVGQPDVLDTNHESTRKLMPTRTYQRGVAAGDGGPNSTTPRTIPKEPQFRAANLFQTPTQTLHYSMIGTDKIGTLVDFQCSILKGDECCSDEDCVAKENHVCANRNCVARGLPRFTLEWYGYDDYDLIVTTPAGISLSFLIDFDPTTGGRVGEKTDQEGLGFHTENTYFPSPGAPAGTYTYAVAEFSTKERVNGWILTVHDERGEVARHKGAGGSETFRYERIDLSAPSPQPRPSPAPASPKVCNPSVDECCSNSECSDSNNICVNRNCIVDNGGLRFTLYWEGNDDIELFVTTPGGATLSFVNDFDVVSGGRVGEITDQLGPGYYVENTYFPSWVAGVFTFSVRPMSAEGAADQWSLEVVDGRESVFFQTGYGASREFRYNKAASPVQPSTSQPDNRPTSRPLPTTAPVQPPFGGSCSILTDECCSDYDCPTTRDLCVQDYCIRDGNPRFTLTWDGNDDLDLVVATPLETTLSRSLIFDPLSGGIFEADNNQEQVGSHFENVYFPLSGSPFGEYSLKVRPYQRNGSADSWTLQLYINGELFDTRTGTGESEAISFVREGPDEPERPPYDGSRCDLFKDECCLASDCDGGQVCVQRVCLERGYPRITLTWTGDDDLDLIVTIPNGEVLSAGINYDPASGARRQTNANRQDYDLNVDSIYFPYLSGTIKYSVDSRIKRGPSRDFWTLQVYEKDTKVQEFTGFGDSKNFFYVPPASPLNPSPPPNPFRPPTPTTVPPPSDDGQCPYECCASYDCSENEVCVQRRCLSEGTLRFSLTWTGNDNVDLLVQTPDGTEISKLYTADDNQYGGFFEIDTLADGDFGFHAENAVFRGFNIPSGTFTYSVTALTSRGARDEWQIQVFAYGQLVGWQRGYGSSLRTFTYEFTGDGSFSPTNAPFPFPSSLPSATPTLRPSITFTPTRFTEIPSHVPSNEPPLCDESSYECCEDSSCGTGEVCVQRQCITDGTPRFTLSWTGNDDLDLAVITPAGSVVSAFQNDPDSGGTFGPTDGDQFGFDFHVESIRFNGSTFGIYEWYTDSFLEIGEFDSWFLSISVNGEEVDSVQGTGRFSGTFEYAEPTGR